MSSFSLLAVLVSSPDTVVPPPPPPPPVDVTDTDFYVTPSGSVSNTGKSWAQSWPMAYAAANVPNFARIWTLPAAYALNSTITYVGKAIQWIGPRRPGDQLQGTSGSVLITGSAGLRYFNIRNSKGGGFHNFAFDVEGITSDCVQLDNTQWFTMVDPYTKTADSHVARNRPLIRAIGADCSHLTIIDPETHAAPIVHSRATRAYNWEIERPYDQAGTPDMTFVGIDLAGGDYDGLVIQGGYMERHANNSVRINMTGITGRRRVWLRGIGEEREQVPSVSVTNCRLSLEFGGGRYGANGIYTGSGTTGFASAPGTVLQGDLNPGVMT